MNKTEVENTIRNLHIDSDNVPIDYCWSGYTKNIKEFEEANFYETAAEGHKFFVCSVDNAIALCDYVSNKILRQQCVWDTENVYSPGCDIWFLYAWEMMFSSLDELPTWIQNIIEYLILLGIIVRCNVGEQEYFILVDTKQYLDKVFPIEFTEKIEQICQKGIIEFWNDCLDDVDGNLNELVEPECGNWGKKQFDLFVENPEYEIMACCTSENDHSIGFGISVPYREWLSQDEEWIYEGMADSISENWHEFDDIVTKVEAQGIEFYRSNSLIPESKAEVTKLVHELLHKVVGDFSIGYEVNGTNVEMNYLIDVNETLYDIIIHNFAIDYRIFHEIKS